MEHFLDPANEMMNLVECIGEGGFFLIEVPGLFSLESKKLLYGYPARYFQIAHIIQFFYKDFLCAFYSSLGLEVVYGDETATFILKKQKGWNKNNLYKLNSSEFDDRINEIEQYLKNSYYDYMYKLDLRKFRALGVSILKMLGMKEVIKQSIRRFSKASH